ncbi:hypothetical protein NPS46_06935 [Pseudomonas putida]|uniref:hypothetical protein n=1 Tax=Pseudomonas putida TaxID=303 RepID=UPI0023634048|nr:hypothetical protein [Pseudomonas putida]MDD2052279.1 hypothetical protein [Pseudomonas putida]
MSKIGFEQATYVSDAPPVSGSKSAKGVFVKVEPIIRMIAKRLEEELEQAGNVLKDLACRLVQPLNDLSKWFYSVLGKGASAPGKESPTPFAPHANAAMSADQYKIIVDKAILESARDGLCKANVEVLLSISRNTLESKHAVLATGNGALRRVVTALSALSTKYSDTDINARAGKILNHIMGTTKDKKGLAFSQWGTTGSIATTLVQLPDQLRGKAGADQELAEADACLEQAAADIRQLAPDISQLALDVLKLLGDPESTNKTAETQSAPLGDITGEESEHEALFESLKKSLSVEQDSSAITIKHLDLALMLRAMREGSISPNELGERVKTGADLKVLQSLYQARDIEAPSLEKSLSELATGTQGSDTALGNISVALMRLFRETETRWKLASKAMPAVAEDVLRARFNTHLELQLRNQLQGLDSTITEQVLKQLQNESLGKCLSSVFGEVDKLRRASLLGERTMPMVSLMIATLREQLKLSTRAQGETQSQSWSLLAPEELVALARVMQEDERVAAPGPAVLGQTPR